MLAGPNGAGKSTFYESYLSGLGLPFLNADVLAKVTGMEAYEAANRIADARKLMVARQLGFVTETEFSDPIGDKVDFLSDASQRGYDVQLIFIGITDAKLCAQRVSTRVKAGGHDVPIEKIMARYGRTLDNLERAIARKLRVTLYDNSSYERPYLFLAEFRDGSLHSQRKGKPPAWAARFLTQSEG